MKKASQFALSFVGIAAIAAGAFGISRWRSHDGSKTEYREHQVHYGTIEVNVLATGVVQPENRLEIKPPIAGRAEKVLLEEGQKVKAGQPLLLMSSTERAALLDAARARGPEELKKWQELYRPAPVLAPVNGTIILKNIEPGQTFTTNDAVYVMSDRLTVQAQVDETDIGQVRVGEAATIFLDAYPDQKIEGKVDKVAFEAKTVNNVTTYTATIVPDETPDFMRSGMTANVTFKVATKDHVLTIPADAIKTRGEQKTVLLAGQPPREQSIETGITDGKRVEVSSGLAENDRVLVPKIENFLKAKNQGANPFGGPMSNTGQGRRGSGGGGGPAPH